MIMIILFIIMIMIMIMIPFRFQFIRERIDLEALMLLSEADLGEVRVINYDYDDEYDLVEVCFVYFNFLDSEFPLKKKLMIWSQ